MKDMPQLGMGTFRLEGEEARESVSKALEVGFRHIDTAQLYNNEAQVGDAIKTSGIDRGSLFVTTKVWHESLAEAQRSAVAVGLAHWAALLARVRAREARGH